MMPKTRTTKTKQQEEEKSDISEDSETFVAGTLDMATPREPAMAASQANVTATPARTEDEPICLSEVRKGLDTLKSIDNRLSTMEKQFNAFETNLNNVKSSIDFATKSAEEAKENAEEAMKKVTELTDENTKLKSELSDMKARTIQLEAQSRRNNLLFYGLPEKERELWEDCENAVKYVLHEVMGISDEAAIKFERVHRVGPKIHRKDRAIIARFCFFKDRELAWSKRGKLKGSIYRIAEDYPQEILAERQQLYPILKAAKNCEGVKSAVLKFNKLHIDGRVNTCKTLQTLPSRLNPANFATKHLDNAVLFCSKFSALSNFYSESPIRIKMRQYCSTEQYYQYTKAEFFSDDEIASKILSEPDPQKIHALGKRIKNCNEEVWLQRAPGVLYEANMAKFSQLDVAKEALLSTGRKTIAEATVDPTFGIGLRISDPAAKDPSKWTGKNLFGQILEKIRAELQK
jgi:ribA/ribD-fused uncharacterized protein